MLALLRDLFGEDSAVQLVGQSTDAQSALCSIRQLMPDVVILDIALHNSNGLDVLRALPPRGAGRPVVLVLSNFVTQPYRDEAKRLGADGFFDKSREIVALLEVIVSMAKRGREA